MKLSYKSRHLSIDQFDTIDIPNLMVLTGVNGSGKSHLLEAIVGRHVIIEDIQRIAHFNYENFKLDNEGSCNGHQIQAERGAAWQYYVLQIKPHTANWKSSIKNYGELKALCISRNESLWDLITENLASYKHQIFQFFNSNDNIKSNPQAQGIFSLLKRLPYSLDEVTLIDFDRLYKPFELKNNFLPHQLGKVFWDYYVKYRTNEINEFQNLKNNKGYEIVSEDEFISTHGPKPWEVVNKILGSFDSLKYRVNSPEGLDYFGDYQLKLEHVDKKSLAIDFSHLSSGERVLMALVASVYKSSADNHFPELLLLDEVDASLHPSMIRNMIEVLEGIFIKQKVNIILVTHSPTTIALAPEDSTYVMNRFGPKRIEKKSKQEALKILTQGFVTLEQGLKLIDQIAHSKTIIISEGNNSRLIRKAIELHGITDVEVLSGAEAISGKAQLKTLFQFFSLMPHSTKALFVWDCDVTTHGVTATSNTVPFILPHNVAITIVKKGIENAFPTELFASFIKTIKLSDGRIIEEFDETRKRDFESFILDRSKMSDFKHFESLIQEIIKITQI